IVFDGSDDYLSFDGSIITNSDFSIFAVVRRNTGSVSNHFFLGGLEDINNQNLHIGWRSSNTFTTAQYGNDYDFRCDAYQASEPGFILSTRHSTTLGKSTYINGGLRGVNLNTAVNGRLANLSDWPSSCIGRYFDEDTTPPIDHIDTYFNGWIAELIFYNRHVSETERKAIEAYLSTKYNLPVGITPSPDYYSDIAEVTVLASALSDTKVSGGLTLLGEYISSFARIRAGHNNAEGVTTTFNPDIVSYPDFQRISREWYLEFTGGSIETTFTFDLDELGIGVIPNGDQYRLLFRKDTQNNYSALTATPTLDGNTVSFYFNPLTAVNSSGFYSLGTLDSGVSILPVELTSFLGTMLNTNSIQLQWITQSESNLSGYYLLRNNASDYASAYPVSPIIPAHNSSTQTTYTWVDFDQLEEGVYYYWLHTLDLDGINALRGEISVNIENTTPQIPDDALVIEGITSAYPNPFNPSVTISYSLANQEDVRLSIYNTRGQLMKEWHNLQQKSGKNEVVWDAGNSPSGIYFVKMTTKNSEDVRKITLIK
ncbi:MAG: T9SS type A sorting domain-containing protein, partial [Candidatus Cloacimonetes bacterium]|nr:T9SS type A sorting domain-containing protein [Candidatus Cloacimonadota bacterium]